MTPLREDVRMALGFAAVGTLLVLVVPELALQQGPAAQPAWLSVLLVVAAAAGQTQRRARPLVALGVAAAVLVGSLVTTGSAPLGVALVLVETLYAAVLFTPARTSRAVAGATAAVATALALGSAVTDGWRDGLYVLLNLGLLLAVPVVWAHEVRGHRERADAERDRAEAVARVAELDRAAAVTAERTRMARDLHDVVAGQLSAIALQSEAALARPDADPALLRRVLGEVRRGSVASLAEMRTMIGLLRADGPDEPRTAPAGLDGLGPLLDSVRASGLRVELDDRRAAAPVSAAVDLAAHRILAEALTNAAKHAPGSTVRCLLADGDGALRVEVVNDLVPGAAPGPGTRTGLLGLGERAAAVGGRLDAGPEDGRWAVRANLPGSA